MSLFRCINDCLVVPPFEAAWLAGEEFILKEEQGCISFEAKADNDITIILRAQPGSRRIIDHSTGSKGAATSAPSSPASAASFPPAPEARSDYLIVLGSHRNSRLKVERNGRDQVIAAGVPGSRIPCRSAGPSGQGQAGTVPSRGAGATFHPFWIMFDKGTIAVGEGSPGSGPCFSWSDPDPIPGIRYVGLSTWDRHIAYRRIRVLPVRGLGGSVALAASSSTHLQAPLALLGPGHGAMPQEGTRTQPSPSPSPSQVPSLVSMCCRLLEREHLRRPDAMCDTACVAEALRPTTDALWASSVGAIARDLDKVFECDPLGLACLLSVETVEAVLGHPDMELALPPAEGEELIFRAVSCWAFRAGDWDRREEEEDNRAEWPLAGRPRPVSDVERLLPHVRFPLMSTGSLLAIASAPHPLYAASPALRDLVREALEAQEAMRVEDAGAGAGAGAGGWDAADCRSPSRAEGSSPVQSEGGIRCTSFDLAGPLTPMSLPAAGASAGPMGSQLAPIQLPAAGPQQQGAGGPWSLLLPPTALRDGSRAESTSMEVDAAGGADRGGGSGGDDASAPGPGPSSARRLAAFEMGDGRLVKPASGALAAACARLQRRLSSSCAELLYMTDGDKNGALYYIATGYGSRPWRNPALDGLVEVRASSPASRFTDPRAVVGRKYLNTSHAGPSYSDGRFVTWWQLDLGPSHRLVCNYYTLRQDGSEDYARNWVLQGSADALEWRDLSRHVSDTTIRWPGQYASWAVRAGASLPPYRYFRLFQTGPNAGGENPNIFALSHLELYGFFYALAH